MTWENTDRERVAQIRHATRNRCGATGHHRDHTHVCTSPGDHSGFGMDLDHAADCNGRLFTWPDAPVQLELFTAVA